MATEDTMENGWGVKYITYTEKRCGRRTFNHFRTDVEKAVPGFTLHSVQMCGTDANAVAISLASEYNYGVCLFAIGSYIGGDECHQSLSSSISQNGLGIPKPFDTATPQCQEQTVPLPYHVPCELLQKDYLRDYENRCLVHLHQRLLHARFIGKPYKALLLEYILGGNGGELSLPFLERLGHLLRHFNVSVVVDEILTGGRVATRSIAMTPGMPSVFIECVHCITFGKIVGCGLVLMAKHKYADMTESLRGFSTQAECGLPSKLFEEILKRVQAGMIEDRRAQVLKLMNCVGPDKEEDHWGRGLQIYTVYSRGSIIFGLRNRCLPRLEKSKLKKNDATRTKWNRSTVCQQLMTSTDDWIFRQNLRMYEGPHSITTSLISFLFYSFIHVGRNEEPAVYFRSEDVVEFLGVKGAEIVEKNNDASSRRKGIKVETLVRRAISDAITNTKDSRLMYKKRRGYSRVEYNVFDAKIFYVYSEGLMA